MQYPVATFRTEKTIRKMSPELFLLEWNFYLDDISKKKADKYVRRAFLANIE